MRRDTISKSRAFSRITLLTFGSCSAISLSFLDPINWPKQIALLTILPYVLVESLRTSNFEDRIIKTLFATLGISLTLFSVATFLGTDNITRILWGAWGRNNGLMTIIGLLVLAGSFALLSSYESFKEIVIKMLSVAFIPASLYGIVQAFFSDPINWSNKNQVFSFFGNANFASSILAISAIASFYAFRVSRGKRESNIYLAQFFLALIVVWQTNSLQGLVAISISFAIFGVKKFISKRKIKPSLGFLSLLTVGTFFGLGFAGIGPLGGFLFQYTVQLRTFYWQTGIKMGLDSPLFGVGSDSYGDYYRIWRTMQMAESTTVDLTVDNAHNSIVQIFATLGLIGVLGYLVVFLPGLWVLLKILANAKSDIVDEGLGILFVSSFLISLISIDNIGVAIINWTLAGIFLGVAVSRFTKSNLEVRTNPKLNVTSSNLNVLLPSLVGILTTVIFVFSWYSSSVDRDILKIFQTPTSSNDRQAIDRRWSSLLAISESNRPIQEAQYRYIVRGIQETEIWTIALRVAEKSLIEYPKDFLLIDQTAVLAEKVGDFERAVELRKTQLDIDPRHPRVRLYLARDYVELGNLNLAKREIKIAKQFSILLDANGVTYLNTLENRIMEIEGKI